jgi:hypothetical protein
MNAKLNTTSIQNLQLVAQSADVKQSKAKSWKLIALSRKSRTRNAKLQIVRESIRLQGTIDVVKTPPTTRARWVNVLHVGDHRLCFCAKTP